MSLTAPKSLTSGCIAAVKPGAASLQRPTVEPVLQTMIQPEPTETAPVFTVFDVGTGGLHDGKFNGSPCVLFAAVHASNAGTSGTRTGEAPTGCSCDAMAELAIIPNASNALMTERTKILIFIRVLPPHYPWEPSRQNSPPQKRRSLPLTYFLVRIK
jgi:hypothetical protein